MIATTVVLRWLMLHRAFYTQDDYLMLAKVAGQPLSPTLLLQGYSGHLFPGGFAWAWADAHWSRLEWDVTVIPVVLLLGITLVLMWLVLGRLLGSSWWRVPLLVVFAWCPLTLWSIQWWAVAIQFLPVTAFVLSAILVLLAWRRHHPTRAGLGVAVCMIGALLFQERGLLVLVIVAGLCLAMNDGDLRTRVHWMAVRDRRVLAPSIVVAIGYLIVHRVLVPFTPGAGSTMGEGVALLVNVLVRNALPGMWGGAWLPDVSTRGMPTPPLLAVLVAVLASAALIVHTVRVAGSAAAWAWAFLGAVALANVALLFGGRSGLGPEFGLIMRYAGDLVVPLVVCLALIARRWPREPKARAGARAKVPLIVALAYLGSSALTTGVILPATFNDVDRSWVTTARAELRARPATGLLDGGVPDAMMVAWFGPDARASTVLAAAPERPVFDQPAPALRMFDPQGRLVPVTLVEGIPAVLDSDECGQAVGNQGVSVSLSRPVGDEARVLRLTYFTDTSTTATVSFGGVRTDVEVTSGAHSVEVPVQGPAASFDLRIAHPRSTLCLTAATVGLPFPGTR